MLCRLLFALVLAACAAAAAHAEPFAGIEALDTLARVRRVHPQARLEPLATAPGAQEVAWRLTGPGIDGALVVWFHDWRAGWRAQAEALAARAAGRPADAILAQSAARFARLADMPDDAALRAAAVVWQPAAPVMLEALAQRDGPPAACQRAEAGAPVHCRWPARGITATLDDGDRVRSVEFRFGREAYERALVRRQAGDPRAARPPDPPAPRAPPGDTP